MAIKDWPGGVISKTPVVPSGGYPNSTASGVWTLDQAAYWTKQQQWPGTAPSDPYYEYVSLLLTGDGTNGAQNNTFLDSSTNNFTITRNGNTTQGTFSPYGNLWSNYFDGSGDYLTTPNNAAFDLGTSDATIETWFMVTGNAALDNDGLRPAVLLSTYTSSLSNAYALVVGGSSTTTGTGLEFARWSSGVKSGVTYTGTISQNVWHHVAVVRSGSNLTLYYDGVSVATNNSFSGNINAGGQSLNIARLGLLGYIYDFNGYISNTRIVKGTALYTSNFTPSTTPLTAVSGTSLLTCQSNRFVDNSSNNFTLTVNGNTSVQRFSPFNPTSAYSAATIGGSAYFDGSGDWLALGTQSIINVGTGDITLECWINFPAVSTTHSRTSICAPIEADTSSGIIIALDGATQGSSGLRVAVAGTSQTYATAIKPDTWHHIAVVRSSGTVKAYLNGASILTFTASGSLGNPSFNVGALKATDDFYSDYFKGYISNFRIVKGTAVYTANFTPPTTPLTAITNTSLLCNFTNAGIPDAAMMNDLETVGNAQVSTSVKKYGTGSLAFDGTGDALKAPYVSYAYLGTGNFTIECWAYFNSLGPSTNEIICFNSTGSGGYAAARITATSTGALYFLCASAATTWINTSATATSTVSTGSWYHIAAVRNGSSFTLYVNGVSKLTYSSSSALYNANGLTFIGAVNSGGSPVDAINGYIDDLRITKGYARYTANFTPPTAALPVY